MSQVRLRVMLSLPGDAVSVPLARHAITVPLARAGIAADCLHEVELVVSEACTNAVHHCRGEDGFELVVTVRQEYATIEVIDSGGGFAERLTTAQMSGASSERGRGLAMIVSLVDDALFDTTDDGHGLVRLVKRLCWRDDAPLLSASPEAG